MMHAKLRTDMQKAMKAGDAVRLQTLRLALSACTSALVEQKKKPTDIVEDTIVVAVLRRMLKQRDEAAMHYRNAGQEERASAEEAEREILKEYLPTEMTEEEVRVFVVALLKEMNISEKKDRGILMKAVMQKLQGRVNGSVVSGVLDSVLE